MAERQVRARKAPVSRLRVLAVLLGLVAAGVGAVLLWDTSRKPTAQTPVLAIVVRPETPAVGGPARARVVGSSEPQAGGDETITIAFDTRSVQGRRHTDHQIKAEVLSEPGRPQLATDPKRVLAMEHLSLIADEVGRRTSDPLYTRATRSMGEWVSIEGGEVRWAAWVVFGVGLFVALLALPIRRYGVSLRHDA